MRRQLVKMKKKIICVVYFALNFNTHLSLIRNKNYTTLHLSALLKLCLSDYDNNISYFFFLAIMELDVVAVFQQ